MKRCFIGIPLDEAARADLAEAVEPLDGAVPGLRLVAPELLHVTVKFLGDVEDPQLPAVIAGMTKAAAGTGAFDLTVTQVRTLPHGRRPRILTAMLDPADALLELHERLEEAAHALGFPLDGRAYNPHITLGRFKPPRPRKSGKPVKRDMPRRPQSIDPRPQGPADPLPIDTGFHADRLLLIHSELTRSGPTYTTLTSVELRAR